MQCIDYTLYYSAVILPNGKKGMPKSTSASQLSNEGHMHSYKPIVSLNPPALMQLDEECRKKSSTRSLQPFDVEEAPVTPRPSQSTVKHWLHWGLSLGTLYLFNLALAKAVAAAGISFPSPLLGEAPHAEQGNSKARGMSSNDTSS